MGGYALTLVEWLDIVAQVGWEDITHECKVHPCFSIGWLLSEDEKQIVLASTISSVDGETQTNNRIVIPKATITSQKVLNGTDESRSYRQDGH